MTFEEKLIYKVQVEAAQVIKNTMTAEQKIQFLNTPYRNMPPELQPGMVKNPQLFNFVRITHRNIGQQKETFGSRLIRWREACNMTPAEFCSYCNKIAEKYDLPATVSHRAQRTRITARDISNYEDFNVSPKIDKMTIIATAMGVDIDYFAGYGAKNRRSKSQMIEARRKRKAG